MDIVKARQLKVGDRVSCPADRGNNAYQGVVSFVSTSEYKNALGVPYIWVNVKGNGKETVWPSNRLGWL